MIHDSQYVPLPSIGKLRRGDTIRHKVSGNAYTVIGAYGTLAIAVDTIAIKQADDWLVERRQRVRRDAGEVS